jgi:cation diffusion facilitator family transporter
VTRRDPDRFELPPHKQRIHRRAVKIEILSIAYLVSAIVFVYLTLGSSQAMKAAWIEDILSLGPPIAFLVAARVRRKTPNPRFPWGYHRAVSVAYLWASLAILALGTYILIDSLLKLFGGQHPPIGVIQLFDQEIWAGWFMVAALAWTGIPAVFLGRVKLPLSAELHDKVLYADATMNKADWMTAFAAMVGVVAIGFGVWWADAAAATVIALDIVHDGWKNTRAAVVDLMDRRPTTHDDSGVHPLPAKVESALTAMPWVKAARVRLREEGHVFTGEAFVVPRDERDLVARVRRATTEVQRMDWRLNDLAIVLVPDLDASLESHPGVSPRREEEG